MYIYFDSNGYLKEFINDPKREGSQNVNKLYIYIEPSIETVQDKIIDNQNVKVWMLLNNYPSGTADFRLMNLLNHVTDDDGNILNTLSFNFEEDTVYETIPYNKDRDLKYFVYGRYYQFIKLTIPSEVLLSSGEVSCSLSLVNPETSPQTQYRFVLDIFTFIVQDSVIKKNINITQAEYAYLLATKIGIANTSLVVTELPETGNNNIFYVLKSGEEVNIYIWNGSSYVWVGSNELNLSNYYTKAEGEALEARVTNVEGQISGLSNGSPKGVYDTVSALTTADPNHLYIYIVLADLKWYYWNGTAWTAGGTYLSSAPDNNLSETSSNSVENKVVTKNILNNTNGIENICIVRHENFQITGSYYLNYTLYKSTIKSGTKLNIRFAENTQVQSIACTYSDGTTGILGDFRNKTFGIITPVKDVVAFGYYIPVGPATVSFDIMIFNELPFSFLNTYEGDWLKKVALIRKENIDTTDSAFTNYSLFPVSIPSGSTIFIYKDDYNFVNILATYSDGTYGILTSMNATCISVTAPKDIVSMGYYIPQGYQGDFGIAIAIADEINVMKEAVDKYKLGGKKWGGLGDSMTASYLGLQGQYWYFVSKDLGLLWSNYGLSGSCIASGANDATIPPMVTRYQDMSDDLDIITVFGGTNDYGQGIPIGTNDDVVTTTFKGALKTLISGLLYKYQNGQKIAFITPIQRNNAPGLEAYVEAMKEICAMYSIPCLDLYHEGGITTKLDANAYGLLGDGLHPTELGHKMIANKIRDLLTRI